MPPSVREVSSASETEGENLSLLFSPPVDFGDSPLPEGALWVRITALTFRLAPAEKGRFRTESGNMEEHMSLTQEEFARAFGVEDDMPAADADTDTGNTGTEQNVQEPESAPAPDGNGAGGAESDPAPAEDTVQEQDAETRRRQAYGRRQREREAQQQTAEAAAQARVDRIYADMFHGQNNPYTGQPIRSEADYRAYQEADRQARRTAQLQSAGIDPETVRGMVDEAVRPLRQQMQRQELASIREQAKAVNDRAQETIRQGVESVRQLYGAEVGSLEDIAAMPTGPQFNAYVQKGLSIEEAYYLANRKDIDTRRLGAARQAGINRANGKGHLAGMPAAAGESPYQPTEAEKEAYRAFMPDATDAEIAKAYGAYRK